MPLDIGKMIETSDPLYVFNEVMEHIFFDGSEGRVTKRAATDFRTACIFFEKTDSATPYRAD